MSVAISVIVPFYKTPLLALRICINRLLEQSFQDFELLLVDDGNGSEYDRMLLEYQNQDSRVRWIRQPQSGVSAARNNGIQQAKGEYIVFCDSDDFVENNYLHSLYHAAKDVDLVICGVKGQHFPSIDSVVDHRVFFSSPAQYNWLQYTNFTVNKIFKKSVLDANNIRFDSKVRLGEDALFLEQYFRHCKKIRCISQNLYTYVYNNVSAVHKFHLHYWDWEKQVIATQHKMFNQYPLSRDEQMFQTRWMYIKLKGAMYYYHSHKHQWKQGDGQKYLEEIFHSPFMKELLAAKHDNNPFLNRNDRLTLLAWKHLGLTGMRMIYRYTVMTKGH